MSLLARAKVTTPLALVPGETSFGVSRYLREGNTIRVYDTKKVGLKTFYSTKDNLYINAKDLQIVRDDEYFFANFKTRNLQKNNLGMTGAKGLTATLGDNNELSDMWMNLQLFALSDSDTIVGGGFGGGISSDEITTPVLPALDNIGKVPDNYKEQQPLTFEDIGNNIIHGVNETVNGITTMAAGQVNGYIDNVLNSDISIGGLGNSGIMKGVTINSILNGTALNTLLNNVMNALNDWIVNKLKYVVGFSLESAISGLFQLFGVNFKTAFSSGAYNMFGTAGLVNTSSGYHSGSRGNYYDYNRYEKRETKYDKVNIGTEGVYNNINWIDRIQSGYGVRFFEVQFDDNHDPIYKEFKYAEVTQAMLDYFKYKGCDGRMIVKHYAGRTWVQDESYATPTLTAKKSQEEIDFWKHQYDRPSITPTKSQDEIGFWKHQYDRPGMTPSKVQDDVKLWQTLYNATYDELTDSLKVIKKQFDLTAERSDMVNKFNRFRVPVLDEELTHSRGYIFFTVPDLNLTMQWADTAYSEKYSALNSLMKSATGGGSAARSARIMSLTANFLKSHETLAKYLMGGVPGHKFIPLFTSRCSGIDVADEVLETTEFGETLTGWKYTYGTSMIKSKTAGNMSISFTDDKQLSIYLMIKIWCEYIHAVWRGESSPKQIYFNRHILDYAISIYYFLTDETGENIIFWTKYTGCFPTSVPSSNFSDSIGNVIHQPKYSVQFSFARKDDNNPMHLGEFNKLSKGGSFKYLPVYNKDSLKAHRSFVGPPFVDTTDGGYTFKLRFRGE